jgi:hypothetical protein
VPLDLGIPVKQLLDLTITQLRVLLDGADSKALATNFEEPYAFYLLSEHKLSQMLLAYLPLAFKDSELVQYVLSTRN